MANDSMGKSEGDKALPCPAQPFPLCAIGAVADPFIYEGIAALVECSTDLVALTTLDQRMTFLNAAGMRLLGLPDLATVRNTVITDYFGEEVADQIDSAVVPSVMATGSWQGILNMRHFQTGERIPVFFNSTLIRHPATDEPIGMGTVGREVTALQRAEQAREAATQALEQLNHELEERIRHRTAELQASEQKFRAIFNNTFQFTGLMTSQGILLEANQTALDFAGLQPQDVLHQPLWQSHWWSLSNQAQQDLKAAIAQAAQGQFIRYEVDLRGIDTNAVTVDFSIRPLQDDTGQVVLLIPEARDISDLKRTEQALRASNEQLVLANQDLSRATRLKDEFLATMSHELRTPLSSILGMTQALRREIYGPLGDRQHHALGIVERSGRHLLALINDVLDLAKIEAGKMDLRLSTLAVADLCKNSLSFVQPQAQQKQIQLSLVRPDELTHIEADELRLKQALINLLDNAVKFTPKGGQVTLTVHREVGGWEADDVVFTVVDTGVGIALTNYDRLFESFVQLDSSLTREHGGTGLGLALVKQIATLHGGSISVVSTPGQGSQFSFRLPIAQGSPLPLPAAPSPSDQAKPPPLQPIPQAAHILVAEDDPANRSLLIDLLHSLHYTVTTACNGPEAVQKALASPPDLIVMDVQMPGMDGLETIRQLRAHPILSQRPIVALTALVMPGDRDHCIQAGATAYMAKPIPIEGFTHLLQRLIQTASSAPGIPPRQSEDTRAASA